MSIRIATVLRSAVLAGAVLGIAAGPAAADTIKPTDTRSCQTPSGNGGGTTYGKCGSICPGGTIGSKDVETNRYTCTKAPVSSASVSRSAVTGPLTR